MNKIEIVYTTPPFRSPCETIDISRTENRTIAADTMIRHMGYTKGYVYTVGSATFLALVEMDKAPNA